MFSANRFLLLLACALYACTPDDSTGLALENCTNGVDDDGNGAVDCNDTRCTLDPACLSQATCGNGLREGLEFCDGTDLGGASCATQGFLNDVGTLGCRSDCAGFDTSSCIRADLCGNGSREGGEQCDGADLADASCLSRGFAEGTLACDATCQFDETSCTGVNPCGNGTLDGTETCDGAELDGQSCVTLGFRGDGLRCSPLCDSFDTSQCEIELCGNGRIDAGELCDGSALPDNRSCASEGFASGSLQCNSTCDAFVTTECSFCGNNTIDTGELCDGVALGGRTCQLEGFGFGELACNAQCDGYDLSSCNNCGNGVIDDGEACDGDTFGPSSPSCQSEGYQQGELGCSADCTRLDTSACTGFAHCGNGTLDGLTTVSSGGDVRIFQEFCEPGIPFHVDPFVLALNPLATGCLYYDSSAPFDDTASIVCNADCTFDISNCESVPTGDFCTLLGWDQDGICDPCDMIQGTSDPACQHPSTALTTCGDGVADGELDGASRQLGPSFFVNYPSSPFDACDGDDLREQTCESLGFKSGTLRCRDDCNFNTSACVPVQCGDGVVEGREVCEPSQSCSEFDSRFTGGTFSCNDSCFTADTSGCTL